MSKEKVVITINNEELPISQCRKFEAGFYKIGDNNLENSGDCYKIDDKYYRIETGQVVYDHCSKEYVIKNGSLTEGIISIDDKGYNLGFFKITDNVVLNVPNGRYLVLSEEILEGSKKYRERLSNGEYYDISLIDAREFNRMRAPSNEYKHSLPYDSNGILEDFINQHNKTEIEISDNVKNFHKALGDLTFGLEFETTSGFIPQRFINKTGLIPLRDGSISGLEYVTIPLSGEKGMQTVINASKILSERTRFDDSCALHLHLGNVPRTPEFILALFKMTCAFQNEMYTMFPLYKKYNFRVKNKNYSEPYDIYSLISKMDACITKDKVNENFEVLYSYLSMGERFSDIGNNLDNVKNHPADREGRAKWNIRTRYHLNNFIPLIFGNKQTVEFRIHTPTFDVNKIIPFLLLNAIIVNFTIRNTKSILENKNFLSNFRLANIIQSELSNIKGSNTLMDSLCGYIANRQQYTEDQNRRGEIKGNEQSIPGCQYINWNISAKKNSSENVIESQIRDKYKIEYDRHYEYVIDMVRKGALTATTGQRNLDRKRLEIDEKINRELSGGGLW